MDPHNAAERSSVRTGSSGGKGLLQTAKGRANDTKQHPPPSDENAPPFSPGKDALSPKNRLLQPSSVPRAAAAPLGSTNRGTIGVGTDAIASQMAALSLKDGPREPPTTGASAGSGELPLTLFDVPSPTPGGTAQGPHGAAARAGAGAQSTEGELRGFLQGPSQREFGPEPLSGTDFFGPQPVRHALPRAQGSGLSASSLRDGGQNEWGMLPLPYPSYQGHFGLPLQGIPSGDAVASSTSDASGHLQGFPPPLSDISTPPKTPEYRSHQHSQQHAYPQYQPTRRPPPGEQHPSHLDYSSWSGTDAFTHPREHGQGHKRQDQQGGPYQPVSPEPWRAALMEARAHGLSDAHYAALQALAEGGADPAASRAAGVGVELGMDAWLLAGQGRGQPAPGQEHGATEMWSLGSTPRGSLGQDVLGHAHTHRHRHERGHGHGAGSGAAPGAAPGTADHTTPTTGHARADDYPVAWHEYGVGTPLPTLQPQPQSYAHTHVFSETQGQAARSQHFPFSASSSSSTSTNGAHLPATPATAAATPAGAAAGRAEAIPGGLVGFVVPAASPGARRTSHATDAAKALRLALAVHATLRAAAAAVAASASPSSSSALTARVADVARDILANGFLYVVSVIQGGAAATGDEAAYAAHEGAGAGAVPLPTLVSHAGNKMPRAPFAPGGLLPGDVLVSVGALTAADYRGAPPARGHGHGHRRGRDASKGPSKGSHSRGSGSDSGSQSSSGLLPPPRRLEGDDDDESGSKEEVWNEERSEGAHPDRGRADGEGVGVGWRGVAHLISQSAGVPLDVTVLRITASHAASIAAGSAGSAPAHTVTAPLEALSLLTVTVTPTASASTSHALMGTPTDPAQLRGSIYDPSPATAPGTGRRKGACGALGCVLADWPPATKTIDLILQSVSQTPRPHAQ